MQTEIKGKVVSILPQQRGRGKNGEWTKNAFVIEWEENGYTQHLCLEVMGEDRFEKMKNSVKVGCDVLCRFSVSSREWNGKYFTSCQCFYCASIGSQEPSQQTQAPQPSEKYNDVPF